MSTKLPRPRGKDCFIGFNPSISDSPVEKLRKELPRGRGNWPGYNTVNRRISIACERLALSPHHYLGDLHVKSMAVLGTGHEETMKGYALLLRVYGWIKEGD